MSSEVPEGHKRDKKISPSNVWGTNEGQNWFFTVLLIILCIYITNWLTIQYKVLYRKFWKILLIHQSVDIQYAIECHFPMQHIYTIDWKRFSLLIGTTHIFTMTRKILTNSSCWKSTISIYVLYRAFQAHFQVSVDAKLKWLIFSLLPHLRSKWFTDAKVRFLSDITQCLSLEITQMCDFSFFFCRSTINHRAR